MNLEQKIILVFIVAFLLFTSILYLKMVLIWKDVMIKKNEKIKKDIERLELINKKKQDLIKRDNDTINYIIDIIQNKEKDTHEEYIEKLELYKNIIDKTPNHFLKFHLDDQVKKEHYELAAYIKEVALKRGFKL